MLAPFPAPPPSPRASLPITSTSGIQCPAGRRSQYSVQRDRGPVVIAEIRTHPRQHESNGLPAGVTVQGQLFARFRQARCRYCWLYRPVPDFVPLGKVRHFDPLSRNPSLGFGFCFEPMEACHAALIEHMHRHAAPIVGTDSVSRHARNMAKVSGRSRQHRPPSLGDRAAHPADLAMSIIFSMTVVGLARLGIGSPG